MSQFGDLPAAIFNWRPGQISPPQATKPRDISRSKESRNNDLRIERDKLKDNLQEQCQISKTLSHQLDDSESQFNTLKQRVEELDSYTNALKERLSQAERRFMAAEASVEKATQSHTAELESQRKISIDRILELQDNARKLQGQISSFRHMITKRGAASDEVDDAAIVSRFTALRDHIQGIVHKSYQPHKGTRPYIGKDANSRCLAFSKFWKRDDLSDPEIRNQIRALIFQCLWEIFFEKPCFGLGNSQGLESGLTSFELALGENNRGRVPFCSFWACLTEHQTTTPTRQNGES